MKMKAFLLLEDLCRIVDKYFEEVEYKIQLSYTVRKKYEGDGIIDRRALSKIKNGLSDANLS